MEAGTLPKNKNDYSRISSALLSSDIDPVNLSDFQPMRGLEICYTGTETDVTDYITRKPSLKNTHFGTSDQRSCQSVFGQSTGNDVSGHYECNYFGTSVQRSSRSAFGRSTGNDVSGY